MIINKVFAKKIYRGITKAKIIGSLCFSENDFYNWCHTVNVINGTDFDEDVLNGRWKLEDYKVPNALSDLVIPRKISLEEGLAWNDLRANDYTEYVNNLKKYDMEEQNLLKPIYFNEITNGILGAAKKAEDQNITTANVLAAPVSYSNYKLRFADIPEGEKDINIKVYDDINGIIPIKAKSMDIFMSSKYYTNNLEDNLDTWLENAMSNLKKKA